MSEVAELGIFGDFKVRLRGEDGGGVDVLIDLLGLARSVDQSLGTLQPELLLLEDYAVKFRYPGMGTTIPQAGAALGAVRSVPRRMRSQLGIARRQRRKTKP